MIRSSEQLVYSRAAAARILGVPVEQIRRVEVWPFVVLVIPHRGFGLRPRFVSKRVFKENFVEFRRQSAKDLLVITQRGSEFTVLNPANSNQYTVTVGTSSIKCTCEDYHNQLRFLGRGCCKHCYRVLFHLGFQTLKDYVNSKAAERLRVVLNSG
jgi:hypothetical protein